MTEAAIKFGASGGNYGGFCPAVENPCAVVCGI